MLGLGRKLMDRIEFVMLFKLIQRDFAVVSVRSMGCWFKALFVTT